MRKKLTPENQVYIIQQVGKMTPEQMAVTMPGIGVKTIQKFIDSLPVTTSEPVVEQQISQPVEPVAPQMPHAGELMGTKTSEIDGKQVKIASVMTEAAAMRADEEKKSTPVVTNKWKFISKIK